MESINYVIVAIIVLVGILLLLVYLRNRPVSRATASGETKADEKPTFHCVTVAFNEDACAAVREIEGKRYLPGEAPIIPLQGCNNPECECRYVHYDDRRQGMRRDPYGIDRGVSPNFLAADRRYTRGRRSTDFSDREDIKFTED